MEKAGLGEGDGGRKGWGGEGKEERREGGKREGGVKRKVR